MLGAALSEAEALRVPPFPLISANCVCAPPPPQAPLPSQLSKRLVKISPDEELKPGEQRQAVALTHVDFRGHHGAQSVRAETVGTKATVRRLKKWRELAASLGVQE